VQYSPGCTILYNLVQSISSCIVSLFQLNSRIPVPKIDPATFNTLNTPSRVIASLHKPNISHRNCSNLSLQWISILCAYKTQLWQRITIHLLQISLGKGEDRHYLVYNVVAERSSATEICRVVNALHPRPPHVSTLRIRLRLARNPVLMVNFQRLLLQLVRTVLETLLVQLMERTTVMGLVSLLLRVLSGP
jgi:hypothetical protein